MDERQRQLEALYEDVLARVKVSIDEIDPIGLLAMGAPNDEYDDAVGELTRRLIHGQGIERSSIETWFESQYGVQPVGVEGLVDSLSVIAKDVQVVLNG